LETLPEEHWQEYEVPPGKLVIPAFVEETPVVFVHSDLGLHNIIISSSNPSEIVGIIDWEFCGSLPYPCLDYMIERLFRKSPLNGYRPEYDHADQLRDAFWGAIPSWTEWNKSEAVKVFRDPVPCGYSVYRIAGLELRKIE